MEPLRDPIPRLRHGKVGYVLGFAVNGSKAVEEIPDIDFVPGQMLAYGMSVDGEAHLFSIVLQPQELEYERRKKRAQIRRAMLNLDQATGQRPFPLNGVELRRNPGFS
jgi:hypothetical protein